MARYKHYDYKQSKLMPVSFEAQILPGSFEHTLCYLVEHEVDLDAFSGRYCNDETGRPAYDPALLLKLVLYPYSKGITSSRQIERCCRENVMFMALSADTRPRFTTIASFISTSDDAISSVFRDILLVCDEQGLMGREMFVIDGVKLPSNASKEWSGTRADFERKVKKMDRAVRRMLAKHRREDEQEEEGGGGNAGRRQREEQQIETLRRQMSKLRNWLKENDDKPGKTGRPRKSNLTDNDSAKMKTSHGVIQGYDGVAAVDEKRQVVVHAHAYGEAQEHELLLPMLEGVRARFAELGERGDVLAKATVVADSGFHTEANVRQVLEEGIDAYVADHDFRKRDPRFADAGRHKTKESTRKQRDTSLFTVSDFRFAADLSHCICPAGKRLYRSGGSCRIGDYETVRFKGPHLACGPCELRSRCLRYPERTPFRQVAYFKGRHPKAPETFSATMKRRIDSDEGRAQYGRRLGIVEPVFGNIRSTLGLDRFSLRGAMKVNIQWLMYCLVHNIGKIHGYGYGAAT